MGAIPEDVKRDIVSIAPMLERLGYDPHAYPPNYGEADKFVAENTQLIKRNEDYWRRRSQEIVSMSKVGKNHSRSSINGGGVAGGPALGNVSPNGNGNIAQPAGAGAGASNLNSNNGVLSNNNNINNNNPPVEGYKYIQKDTDSVDGVAGGKGDVAGTNNEDHRDTEGDHKDIQDAR